jgi:hypothetical protein
LLLAIHFSPSLSSLTLDPLRTEGRSIHIGSIHIGSKPRNDEDCCTQIGEETDRMEASPAFIFVDPAEAAGITGGLGVLGMCSSSVASLMSEKKVTAASH